MSPDFEDPSRLNVLVTGAAGRIGQVLRAAWSTRYRQLRLLDVAPMAPAGPKEDVRSCDIGDLAALTACMRGIDCVVHLAGVPHEDTWERVRDLNIEGCYNVFEAARLQGVKRVVFASSNHAIGFHRREDALDSASELRPDSRYGVSKVFGEALGSMYADKYGMSVACLRIGPFRTPDVPGSRRELMNWVSHRDMEQLTRRCIEHLDYSFLVAYGVSGNTRSRWSNRHVAFLGYEPQDDAENWAGTLEAQPDTEDPVAAQFHGGIYCAREFVGGADRARALNREPV